MHIWNTVLTVIRIIGLPNFKPSVKNTMLLNISLNIKHWKIFKLDLSKITLEILILRRITYLIRWGTLKKTYFTTNFRNMTLFLRQSNCLILKRRRFNSWVLYFWSDCVRRLEDINELVADNRNANGPGGRCRWFQPFCFLLICHQSGLSSTFTDDGGLEGEKSDKDNDYMRTFKRLSCKSAGDSPTMAIFFFLIICGRFNQFID